ncbi:MAG: CD1375 family protein [Caldicoprobacterales bacterium]
MAQFLATQIKLGRITIDDVPEKYRKKVKQILGITD